MRVEMNWQTVLAQGFKDPLKLLTYLGHETADVCFEADALFRTRVPKSFADKMVREDISCPLLKQVLPVTQELKSIESYVQDPLQEKQFTQQKGLLHKYQSRVLITLAPSCAINCRYCFRRHFDYQDNQINLNQWQNILNYIQMDANIKEVIFSGGDPLMVKNERLQHYLESLQNIEHVKTLRFHTRLPIVLPERIDEGFIGLLKRNTKQKVMVMHSNHPRELCDKTEQAFSLLKANNVTLLNQSVLLAKINDDSEILAALSQKLFSQGVLPYYLHLPDKVTGTSHFDVTLDKAKQIYLELQAKLSGYLVPKLVQEIPGEQNKTIIGS